MVPDKEETRQLEHQVLRKNSSFLAFTQKGIIASEITGMILICLREQESNVEMKTFYKKEEDFP